MKPRAKPVSAGSHCIQTLPSTLPRRTLGPGYSRVNITALRHRPQSLKKQIKEKSQFVTKK